MNRIVYILFLVLLQMNAFSQKAVINEHYIGIKGGMNLYLINNDFLLQNKNSLGEPIISETSSKGYSFGISYKNFFEKYAGTSFGLYYTQKGGYSEFLYDENPETDVSEEPILFFHKLEYIEFSTLMNIRLGAKHSRINMYLGPSISYLYRQNLTILEETFGRFYKAGTDFKFEFAVNVGGGYSFSFNKGEVELNLMYTHSLTNVFKAQSINASLYNQTQAITASLFYYFKIIKE